MRRLFQTALVSGLVLATTAGVHAQVRDVGAGRRTGLPPNGCNCVRGPVFEKIRTDLNEETGLPDYLKYEQDASLSGRTPAAFHMFYRDQPPSPQTYVTESGFPPEIVYMAEQFRPSYQDAWARVDFSVLVSVVSPPEHIAGLAYALYVKEDGGDGMIENPGVMTCGGDDVCGYLEQTYNAPWLVATDSHFVWSSVGRSDFFKASGTRLYEVQVHVFPIHAGAVAGLVVVNNGTMMISSGRP